MIPLPSKIKVHPIDPSFEVQILLTSTNFVNCFRKTTVCNGDQLLDFAVPKLFRSQSSLALTRKSFRIARVSHCAAQRV